MNPRIYYKAMTKSGEANTTAHRMRAYRQAKKLGLTCVEYRKHQEREFKRLYAFLSIKDYGRAAVTFKQAMQEAHPDHGGDPEAAGRIIVAWDEYKKRQGWSGPAPTVTQPDTHLFTGNAVATPICLMRAGKRAKRGERFTKAVGKPTCQACLEAIEAAALKSKADVKAAEDEFNARRQKEIEAATDRCAHGVRNDDIEQDCLICFPVDDEPTVTPPEPEPNVMPTAQT